MTVAFGCHYRDQLGNAPCGVRRTRGVTSTRKEGRVTCLKCLAKLKSAAGRIAQAAEHAGPSLLHAQISRAEAEVEFLRSVVREAWTVLDGPGDQGAKINTAKELLQRVPGVVSSGM